MEVLWHYLKAFAVGGLLCLIGQLLIDRTKLTPARILTSYVVAGVVLGALGLYQPLVDFAGAGASVPLTGFGNLLAKGVRRAVVEKGKRASSAFSPAVWARRRAASARRSSLRCSRRCCSGQRRKNSI